MSVLRILSTGLAAGLLVAGAIVLRGELRPAEVVPDKPMPATESPLAEAASGGDLDRLLAEVKAVSVAELTGAAWQRACFSRGAAPVPSAMQGCWPATTDRTRGGSYVNVVAADGTCAQWRTARPVIDKRFEDSFCVARADVPGLTLRDKGRLVDIE